MPRPVSLSLDLLRTFLLLVRNEGDAAKTTIELGINQPSMSKRLKYLQHADPRVLPKPWLYLDGKTWKLTDEGKQVYPAVEEITRRYDQLTRREEDRPPVRFGCSSESAEGLALDALRALRRHDDKTRIRVTVLRGKDRIEQVANGSLDLALVTQGPRAIQRIAHRTLHVETLTTDYLALAARAPSARARSPAAEHLAQYGNKDSIPAQAFEDFPIILVPPNSGLRPRVERALRKAGVRHLDIALEVGGWAVILEYVQAGFGLGLVSENAARACGKGVVFRRLDPKLFPRIETRIICRRILGLQDQLDLTTPARAFYESLKEAANPKKG